MNLNSDPNAWKGYTLDELRYRRALVEARTEIEKYRLSAMAGQLKERSGFFGSNSLFSRVAGAISYAEYAILAYRMARKVIPLFRRKK